MSTTINIDPFDAKSIEKAIVEIKRYTDITEVNIQKFIRLLSQRGLIIANIEWSNVIYDGKFDQKISVHKSRSGFTITARGKSVAFIEFGSGVYYEASGNPYPGKKPDGVGIGMYGKHQGFNYYWFYTGKPGNAGGELAHGHKNTTITHGNPANAPMYRTAKQIRRIVESTFREVFK